MKNKAHSKAKKYAHSGEACSEPTAIFRPKSGTVLAVCANKHVSEWKSLSLLGRLAIKDFNS